MNPHRIHARFVGGPFDGLERFIDWYALRDYRFAMPSDDSSDRIDFRPLQMARYRITGNHTPLTYTFEYCGTW